jgi:hypothetical protein
MPRQSTKSLLKELNTLGVRRYVRDGARIEVEFWAPGGTPQSADDRREAYLEERQRVSHEGKTLRDPLTVAIENIDVEEGAN